MLDYDTGSGDNMELLQQHPFMTSTAGTTDMAALETDEMIHRVHMTDTDIILGSRGGNIFVVDMRTLRRREIIKKEKCHSYIRCIASCGQIFTVAGQEVKMSTWRLDSQNNQCIQIQVIDCPNESVIKCLRQNITFLVTYATDKVIRIYKWCSSSAVKEDLTEEPQMSSETRTASSNDGMFEGCLSLFREISTDTEPHSQSLALHGYNLFFVHGSCLKHCQLEPDNADQPLKITKFDFKDNLLCLAPSTAANRSSETKESEGSIGLRHIWVGTKQPGKIMMLDLRTKAVMVEINVFDGGHIRQILPFGKHLMCVVQDPEKKHLSCLCYEKENLLFQIASSSQASHNQRIQFRKVVDFGQMSSELCCKGEGHLFYYRIGSFCHMSIKDIEGIPQQTSLR